VRDEEECVCSVCQILLQYPHYGKIIKEIPGSVASGTLCIILYYIILYHIISYIILYYIILYYIILYYIILYYIILY